jgi:hypothetical protein
VINVRGAEAPLLGLPPGGGEGEARAGSEILIAGWLIEGLAINRGPTPMSVAMSSRAVR